MKPPFDTEEFENRHRNLKDNNPFMVPDGYFDALPGHIQERVARPEPRRLPVFFRPPVFVPVVALVILALLLIRPGTTKEKPAFASLDEYSEYMTENYESFGIDESTIMEVYLDDTRDTVKTRKVSHADSLRNVNVVIDSTITDDDILEYLINQGFDPENTL